MATSMSHSHEASYGAGRHGAVVGIVVNVFLFIIKLFAGIYGRSYAMVADAFHTATDFITSIGVLIGFKIAEKPADQEHPYGHGRAESIAAKLVSIVLILAGLKIGFDSVIPIINRDFHVPGAVALWAAVFSILIKEGLYRYTHKIGSSIQSNSLIADSWHHRSDALSSVATLIGIGGARLGLPVLDPIAAFAVSLFIVKVGLDLFHTAYDELMDAVMPAETQEAVRGICLKTEGVERVSEVRGRKTGIEIFIELTIEVDKDMTVGKSHGITVTLRNAILQDIKGARDVFVHVEPFHG